MARFCRELYLVGVAGLGKITVFAGGLVLIVISCLAALFLGIVLVVAMPCIVDTLTVVCRRSIQVFFLMDNMWKAQHTFTARAKGMLKETNGKDS